MMSCGLRPKSRFSTSGRIRGLLRGGRTVQERIRATGSLRQPARTGGKLRPQLRASHQPNPSQLQATRRGSSSSPASFLTRATGSTRGAGPSSGRVRVAELAASLVWAAPIVALLVLPATAALGINMDSNPQQVAYLYGMGLIGTWAALIPNNCSRTFARYVVAATDRAGRRIGGRSRRNCAGPSAATGAAAAT